MTDEFFKAIDVYLNKINSKNQLIKNNRRINLDFAKCAITEMTPIANYYVAGLQERGIRSKLSGSENEITLKLYYTDGGFQSLSVSFDLNTNYVQFDTSYAKGEGQPYTRTTGIKYNTKNWKNQIFETNLREFIQLFLNYADNRGGL